MINEIGLAFVAVSPVIGLMIGKRRSQLNQYGAFERGFDIGYRNGVTMVKVAANRTEQLREERDRLAASLDETRGQLNRIMCSRISSKQYIDCLNWGSRRTSMTKVYDIPDAKAIFEFAGMGGA